MRRTTLLVLVLAATAAAAPATYYFNSYLTSSSEDPLVVTMHEYGFLPIRPPSNLLQVGSLYFVDPVVGSFTAICNANKADLGDAVMTSSSVEMQDYLEKKGQFATSFKLDIGRLFNGDVGQNYVVRIRSSLTDVVLEEIPLGANQSIFVKLMNNPSCNQVAMEYIRSSGYVCQGQKILKATAEYKLDKDTRERLKAYATVSTDHVNDLVKAAVETQGKQSVVDREGRLLAGAALEYGVSMNPKCLAPPNARFQRVLPRTAFGRVWNAFLFNVVEPILPETTDRVEVAQGAGLNADGTSQHRRCVALKRDEIWFD
jgi:hypothetical protein